ncbi:MAG TPA: 7TM-DISM domain-containing protein [Spirochaetota bacterium]|nr:7TM-DISM domain-containing protein [Spirochaetota bacterium]
MKYTLHGIFLLLLLIQSPLAAAYPAGNVTLDDALATKNISSSLEYIEDINHSLTIADVTGKNSPTWRKNVKQHVNFGYTSSAYWFRFTTENITGKKLSWLLEIDFPPIDQIELYYPDGQGRYIVKKTGDSLPFASRDIKYINYLFNISQNPGSMTCYVKIISVDSIVFNLNILGYSAFLDRFHNEMPLYWIFFGLMIIMILYNLGYFIITRKQGYLYLACFIIVYSILEFNLKGFASLYLWPDAVLWNSRANPFMASLVIFWITLFLYDFNGIKMPWLKQNPERHKIFIRLPLLAMLAALLLAVVSLFINVKQSLMLVYALAFCNITGASLSGIYAAYFRKPGSHQAHMSNIAFSIFGIMALVAILSMAGILPANRLSRWALEIGISFAVVFLSFGMADKLRFKKNKIRAAERRYSHLVENTSEIIFTLDENNLILNINSAVKMHLGFKPEELSGMNILDLVQETWNNKPGIARQMVLEYISDLKNSDKRSVQFRTTLINKFSHEPQELTMTFEYTADKNTGYTLLGKASPVIDDVLSDFLETEQYSYNLNNYFTNAEMMSQRLVRNLNHFTTSAVIMQIRVALREAIINSIEHGNLNLTFAEKTGLPDGESYFNLIKERQMDPALTEKKVSINYSLNRERVIYEISDEGEGFDYRSMLDRNPVSPENLMLGHGRGLLMITSAFDHVEFNEKGNRIVLVKHFAQAM